MDLNIFKEKDSSGKMSKEKFIFKNYKEEYDYIINYCNDINASDLSFKEKVYLVINNFKSIPICENPYCENIPKYKNFTLGYNKYCSKKCLSSDPKIIKQKEEKSFKKFGTKSPAQSKIIKDKIINTNQRKYGGNSPMCSDRIREKSKQTVLEKYGVDNISKIINVIEKRVNSFRKSDFRKNFKKSCIEKYGVEHPWMIDEIHNKTVKTSIKTKNELFKKSVLEKLSNEYKLLNIDYDNRISEIKCYQCNSAFKINRDILYNRFTNNSIICTNCNPIG